MSSFLNKHKQIIYESIKQLFRNMKKFFYLHKFTKWRLLVNKLKATFTKVSPRHAVEVLWITIWKHKNNFFLNYMSFASEVHTILVIELFFAKWRLFKQKLHFRRKKIEYLNCLYFFFLFTDR